MITDLLIGEYKIDVAADTRSLRRYLEHNEKGVDEFASELVEMHGDMVDELEERSKGPTALGTLHSLLGEIACGRAKNQYEIIACWNILLSQQIAIEENLGETEELPGDYQ